VDFFHTSGFVQDSPVIDNSGVIYIGSDDFNLYAIKTDGSQKWRFATGSGVVFSSPAIGTDGTVYIGSTDNHFYAVNPNGREKWVFATGARSTHQR
jgi:outer membrane protein assembly factor BamB